MLSNIFALKPHLSATFGHRALTISYHLTQSLICIMFLYWQIYSATLKNMAHLCLVLTTTTWDTLFRREFAECCLEQLASENPSNRRTAAEVLPLLCQQCLKPVKCTKWSIAHMMQGGYYCNAL